MEIPEALLPWVAVLIAVKPRSIRDKEVAVLRAALQRNPILAVEEKALASIAELTVVSHCGCGCATVHFADSGASEQSSIMADCVGTNASGGKVGVIVWGGVDAINGLGVYGLDGGDEDRHLPDPDSLQAWQTPTDEKPVHGKRRAKKENPRIGDVPRLLEYGPAMLIVATILIAVAAFTFQKEDRPPPWIKPM